MPEYEFEGIPLTPAVASRHILEYLRLHSSPVKRREIVRYVADQHQNGGGKIQGDPYVSVKKALQRLVDARQVVRRALGYYSSPKDGSEPEPDADKVIVVPERAAPQVARQEERGPAADGQRGTTVCIGHGRSSLWRELKDFLVERLHLRVDDFNRVSTAGVSTTERLDDMLDAAAFAFLIMTGEDEQAGGKLHARLNVVHELGLFQGRLGFKKAIILLEEGCEEFSNVHGLGQVRFPNGNISAQFEEIRRVLERETVFPRGRRPK
jgi:predicted nucleotide-binding protein